MDWSIVHAMGALVAILFTLLTVHCTTHNGHEVNVITKERQPLNEPRRICVGCRHFRTLVFESDVFIDKTLFIKEILEMKHKLILITTPRDWMKSVNLEMLRNFLQIPEDKNLKPILPITATPYYNLFVNGRVIIDDTKFSDEDDPGKITKALDLFLAHRETRKLLERPLLISKHADLINNHLGQYPCIFFYFDMVGRPTWWDILYDFRRRIRDGYRNNYAKEKLDYLIANNDTEGMDVPLVLNITNYIMGEQSFHTLYELPQTAYVLTEILHRFHKKKVWIFVDDYHRPWYTMVLYDKFLKIDGKHNFLRFYSDFMEKTFINNTHIEKAVMTGIFPPWRDPYYSVFDHFYQCNHLNGRLMEYYTINQWEMEEYFKIIGTGNSTREELWKWYGGYKINNKKNLQVYNPWSIAQFTEFFKLEPQWASLRTYFRYIIIFSRIPAFKKQLYQLIKGGHVTVRTCSQRFSWEEFEQLHSVFKDEDPTGYGEEFPDKIFMMFYITGYLTLFEDWHADQNYKPLRMHIPNEEIRLVLHGDLKQTLFNIIGVEHFSLNNTYYVNANITNNMTKEFQNFLFNNETTSPNLEKIFEDYLHDNGSYFPSVIADKKGDNEFFYHLLYFLMIDVNCTLNEVWAPTQVKGQPDALLFCDNRLISIAMKFDWPSVQSVMEEHKDRGAITKYHKQYVPKIVKIVAINIYRNGTASTLADVWTHQP